MYLIRKSFTFEAAHQLESAVTAACHECIHGHSYTVEMFVAAAHLDCNEMVLDFAEFKEFKAKIMERWDHGLILHENKRAHIQPLIDAGVLKASKVTFLKQNPTAETMAWILFTDLQRFLEEQGLCLINKSQFPFYTLYATAVRVHETSSGWAEYRR